MQGKRARQGRGATWGRGCSDRESWAAMGKERFARRDWEACRELKGGGLEKGCQRGQRCSKPSPEVEQGRAHSPLSAQEPGDLPGRSPRRGGPRTHFLTRPQSPP